MLAAGAGAGRADGQGLLCLGFQRESWRIWSKGLKEHKPSGPELLAARGEVRRRAGSGVRAALPGWPRHPRHPVEKRIRPVLGTGLSDWEEFQQSKVMDAYAARFLRTIRSVLAPKGSSSNAPAMKVVGSGTGVPLLTNS